MPEKKFNCVYLTTNLINGKQYIGDHSTNNLNDSYIGSGRPLLQRAIKKYGRENFKKEILEIFPTKQEAFDAQKKFISQYNTLNPNGYNISPSGGHGTNGGVLSEETKEKIRKSLEGKKYSEERRKNQSKGSLGISRNKGRKLSKETKLKISQNNVRFNFGKHLSEETKKKIGKAHEGEKNHFFGKPAWNKGIPMSEEAKKSMIKSSTGVSRNKGKNLSDETKEKLRKANLGKKQSEETINKRMKSIGEPWNKGKKLKMD